LPTLPETEPNMFLFTVAIARQAAIKN